MAYYLILTDYNWLRSKRGKIGRFLLPVPFACFAFEKRSTSLMFKVFVFVDLQACLELHLVLKK